MCGFGNSGLTGLPAPLQPTSPSKRCTGRLTANPQVARVKAIQTAYRKKAIENPSENRPTAGEIRKLGLIDATMEEKNLKVGKWIPYRKDNF